MNPRRRFKTRLTTTAAWSLLLLCGASGCRHKAAPPPPPVAVAPPLTPSSITVITPLPSVPPQAKPDVQPATEPVVVPAPAPAPVKQKRRIRHRQPPAGAPQVQAPATTAGAPATAPSPAAPAPSSATASSGNSESVTSSIPGSAIPGPAAPKSTSSTEAAPSLGELSTGTTINSHERTRMLGEIQVQEVRLTKGKEPSTADEHTLLLQIRSFLDKARQAVSENDLDGAQTLTTKARVLLDELQSE